MSALDFSQVSSRNRRFAAPNVVIVPPSELDTSSVAVVQLHGVYDKKVKPTKYNFLMRSINDYL